MQGLICWAATNPFVKRTRLISACCLFIPVLRKICDWVHSPWEAGGGKTWGEGRACWMVTSWVEQRLPPSRGGLWLQGRVLLGLGIYQVYLPFLSSICFMTERDTWFFLILAFLLRIYFKYSNFWHAKRILFFCNETGEMLGFSFFYAASLVSISTKIHSINLIGETFVTFTAILEVVLWSGPIQLLLCVLVHCSLLSVKSSKQRTNLTNLAQNPPSSVNPKINYIYI